MKGNLVVVAILLGAAAILYFLWLDHRNFRLLKLRAIKMHSSTLFAEIRPLLKSAEKRPIERMTIDKTGFVIEYMHPAGSKIRFAMADYGCRELTPQRQEALAMLMEKSLPRISDNHRYVLKKKRIYLPNGQSETYYSYVIRNHYKTALVRAPYYDGSFQQLG